MPRKYTSQRTKAPTIRDVAAAAKVSPMSVSNYLNERFHLMSPDTRKRIEAVVNELSYRPRSQARRFRMGRDFSVGMIVVDPSPNVLIEPFIGHVVSGLSGELAQNSHACLLQSVPDCREDNVLVQNFARADALCIFAAGPEEERDRLFRAIAQLQIPIVAIEEETDRSALGIVNVRQDDEGGGRAIVRHLRANGAQRYLYVTPAPVWPANRARERAMREEIAAHSAETFERLTCTFGNFGDVVDALGQWLDQGGSADAIMANNDHIGIAVLHTLRDRGISVPDEVLVTGFNGFEFRNYSSPRLTSVISPAQELGQVAARVLLDQLDGTPPKTYEHVLPVSLSPDLSTGVTEHA